MTQQIVPAALNGEILGPGDGVRVIGAPHPLTNDRVERILPAGLSVAEMIEAVAGLDETSLPRRFIAYVDGDPIPEEHWRAVRLKRGATLTFLARLEGGNLLRSVAMIAVAVLALVVTGGFAAPLLGATLGTGLGASLLGAAITIGGTLLVNALMPIRPTQLADQGAGSSDSRKPSYSIGGGRNQSQQYAAIPSILGTHRVSPMYAAPPYTEIVGDEQYLRLLFVWGYGPLNIADMRIGETPLGQFDGVESETRYGYPSDTAGTLYRTPVIEEQLSVELGAGAGTFVRTTADDVDAISIDVTAPNGIFRVSKSDGSFSFITVEVRARYRKLPYGDWVNWGTMRFANNVQETLRRGLYKHVDRGQYEVELLRMTNSFTGEDQFSDTVMWTALRSLRSQHPINTRKPVAWTALRIKATAQLNGVVDTFNAIVSSRQKAWSGASWVADSTSSNPADLFRHVLQGAANARPVADSKIDLATLQDWGTWCAGRGYRFSQVRDQVASVYSTLADIAAAGRAIPIMRDVKWSVVYDRDDLPIVQHFTPRNSSGFRGARTYKQMPHALRVRFLNEDKNYAQDERVVYSDGYTSSNATLFESVEFPGVTNADLIWKFGRYHLAQAKLRPETYTLQCDFENLVCTRGDRVRVSHDIPLWGQMHGRVKAIDTDSRTATLDESVIIEPGKAYCIRFRAADGSSLFHPTSTAYGKVTQVALVGTDELPAVGDLFMFGELDRESAVLRVLSIAPSDDLTATLTLVDDAPEIYDADTGAIPDFDSQISDPINLAALAPLSFEVGEYIYAFGSGAKAGAYLSWQVAQMSDAQRFEIQMRSEGSSVGWKTVTVVSGPQTDYKILDLPAGAYSFQIRTLFGTRASDWRTISNKQLLGLMAPPPDVTNFNIAVLGDAATLSWTAIPQPNMSHFEIRYSPLTTGVTWGTAVAIPFRGQGTQLQVPALVGTYLIKAVTQQGVYSVNAALLTSETAALTNFNAVEVIVADPAFDGTKSDVVVFDGVLQLDVSGNSVSSWASVSDLANVYLGTGALADEGIYTLAESVDLGATYTSRVAVAIEAYGDNVTNTVGSWARLADILNISGADASQWSVEVFYRKSPVGGGTSFVLLEDGGRVLLDGDSGSIVVDEESGWSDWMPLLVGDITAQKLQFQVRMRGGRSNTVTPVLRSLAITVDMPDRVEAGSDISIPSVGRRITFVPPLKELQALAVDGQGLASGDRREITAKDETGFTVRFFNAADAPVARTIDFIAKGYGKAS